MRKRTRVGLLAAFAIVFLVCGQSETVANDWSPVVIARGSYRAKLQSMPIEERPNRPLHVYGNAVRRAKARKYSNGGIASVIILGRPIERVRFNLFN